MTAAGGASRAASAWRGSVWQSDCRSQPAWGFRCYEAQPEAITSADSAGGAQMTPSKVMRQLEETDSCGRKPSRMPSTMKPSFRETRRPRLEE